ncbi:MAG: hypothetical protein RMI90_11420, partial [Thermoguttaceae bacterium]|nr:hypothetical protein [Thermoguttaceae bacterium]
SRRIPQRGRGWALESRLPMGQALTRNGPFHLRRPDTFWGNGGTTSLVCATFCAALWEMLIFFGDYWGVRVSMGAITDWQRLPIFSRLSYPYYLFLVWLFYLDCR